MAEFFERHTREELTRESVTRRILLFPVATPPTCGGTRSWRRGATTRRWNTRSWDATIDYPGAFIKGGDGSRLAALRRRAPLVGEHNVEIYGGELGLSAAEIEALRRVGVI